MSELAEALEKNKDVNYGNTLIGDWLCLECGSSYTPALLALSDSQPPFICADDTCKSTLVYDEAM
ncbi:hypothetical protein LCGC14_0593420 [marine sediment metagenome]|uniref:Uncharacterized protein n=1 Tax=marine sediment metagenome TaxID=412755 RepID=A0A0F9RHV9_9ZZZZ